MTVFDPAAPPSANQALNATLGACSTDAAEKHSASVQEVQQDIADIPAHLSIPADIFERGRLGTRGQAVSQALDCTVTSLREQANGLESKFPDAAAEYRDMAAAVEGPAKEYKAGLTGSTVKAGNNPEALKRLMDSHIAPTTRGKMNELLYNAQMASGKLSGSDYDKYKEAEGVVLRARNTLPASEEAENKAAEVPAWAGEAVGVLEKLAPIQEKSTDDARVMASIHPGGDRATAYQRSIEGTVSVLQEMSPEQLKGLTRDTKEELKISFRELTLARSREGSMYDCARKYSDDLINALDNKVSQIE